MEVRIATGMPAESATMNTLAAKAVGTKKNDGKLVLLEQREEASGNPQHVLNEVILDPVTHQVEEADLAGCGPQVFQETGAL